MVSRILTEAIQARDGLEALKTVRDIKQLSHVFEELRPQLIPVTRERDAAQYQKAFVLGIVDYVIKPFQNVRLAMALDRYVRWKSGLLPDQRLTQRQLDRLTYQQILGGETPFYGNENTQQKVLSYITTRGGESFTAAEAAKAVGISQTTARRYLEHLQKEGQLEVLQEYGHVGRPVHHYRTRERESI